MRRYFVSVTTASGVRTTWISLFLYTMNQNNLLTNFKSLKIWIWETEQRINLKNVRSDDDPSIVLVNSNWCTNHVSPLTCHASHDKCVPFLWATLCMTLNLWTLGYITLKYFNLFLAWKFCDSLKNLRERSCKLQFISNLAGDRHACLHIRKKKHVYNVLWYYLFTCEVTIMLL